MRVRSNLLFVLSFIFLNPLFASDLLLEFSTELEKEFFNEWQKNQTTNIDTLTIWLIADGMTDSATINQFTKNFDLLNSELNKEINANDDPEEKAEDIFKYLHNRVFKGFRKDAKFKDLFLDGSYNAITGNAFYYLLCIGYNIPIEIITTSYYTTSRIRLENKTIDIEITDKKRGFDVKSNRKNLIRLLVELNVIEEEEYKSRNIDQLFEEYFGFFDSINPYKLTGILYHNNGINFLELGNLESALKNFEKALLIDPDNDYYLENYKYSLYNLSDITFPYSNFLPHLENALWLLNNDPTFIDVAILMSTKTITFYADENLDFKTALDLIMKFKTSFLHDKYVKTMNELEELVNYEWSITLFSRGEYEDAYKKMKRLYTTNPIPKYKDAYVEMAMKYANILGFRLKKHKKANQIIDSVYTVASEYPVVKEVYITTVLAPILQDPRYVERNPKTAFQLAHKAYKISPEHNLSKFAISRVYHEMAMAEIRKNNRLEAHKILIQGLDYIPGDELLNEDLVQLEDTF